MKKKKLALLLAVAMTVTSIDSTAMMVNAADFTSEEVQGQSVELTDEPSEATVETDAETEDGGVLSENSSEDESIEITDELQESADTGGEDTGIDIQEESSPEDVFSVGDEIAVLDDEVKSVSATNVLLDGVAGIPFYTSADLEVTYTGGRDAVRTCQFNYEEVSLRDSYTTDGTEITVTLEGADGHTYGLGSRLEAGTYTMKFTCGDIVSEPYTVSIKQMSDSPLYKGPVNLNEDTEVESPLQGVAYYSFEAPTAGNYYMDTCDSNYRVYVDDGKNSYSVYDGSNWYQEEQQTAYIGFYGGSLNSDANEDAIMKIKTQSEITSVEYTAESTTAIEGLDNLWRYSYMPGILTLTYKDGTKDTLRAEFGNTVYDTQGQAVYSETCAVNGEEETPIDWNEIGNVLPAGKYRIYFMLHPEEQDFDNSVNVYTDLTVNELDYDSLISLEMGEHELEAGELQKKWYSFSPKEEGKYRFNWNVGDYSGDSEGFVKIWYKYENGKLDSCFDHWNMERGEVSVSEGVKYIVGVVSKGDKKVSLNLTKVKTLTSIKMTKRPEQTTLLPGGRACVSLKGMEITASYADGDDETIAFGQKDSQGMGFKQNDSYTWVTEELCRVPVSMGGCQIDVEFEAADWEDVPKMKSGTGEKLDTVPGNQTIRRFIPDKSGYYSFSATNADIDVVDSRTQKSLSVGSVYLEAGNTYQIYVAASGKDVILKAVVDSCDWEVIKQIAETCTTDGKVVRRCKKHGETSTATKKAPGHDWSRWKVTKKATVLTKGVRQRRCSVCGKTETASVAKLPATIALNVKGSIPLKVKQSFNVKVTMGAGDRVVSWRTSNKKYVSVKNGRIQGLRAGKSATITVQLASGKKASFKVNVQKAAVATKSIRITNTATGKIQGKSATLKRGQRLKLKATLTPVTSLQKVTWYTSHKKIVTVSRSGVIKAKNKGRAIITVRSGNKKYNIRITVR
ncbi:Ig-like domain-containing protein [Blautia sp.]|uniref:Ig-like domain-containing protein n=1 Tax=Blautia sp. TaxID=1955243 RepID=UPI003A8D4D0E